MNKDKLKLIVKNLELLVQSLKEELEEPKYGFDEDEDEDDSPRSNFPLENDVDEFYSE